MGIALNPRIEAILVAQVAAGQFASIEEAVTAAVLGVPLVDGNLGDLSWAAPYLKQTDDAIAQGLTVSETEAFAEIERRLGKI